MQQRCNSSPPCKKATHGNYLLQKPERDSASRVPINCGEPSDRGERWRSLMDGTVIEAELRGAARVFFEERCPQAPQTPSSIIQAELREQFQGVSLFASNACKPRQKMMRLPGRRSLLTAVEKRLRSLCWPQTQTRFVSFQLRQFSKRLTS